MALVNVVQTVVQWKQNPPQLASSTKEKDKMNAIYGYTNHRFCSS